MNKHLISILIIMLAAGVALSACGGNGDSTPDTIYVSATPKPEIVAQLSATVPVTDPTIIAQAPAFPTAAPFMTTLPPGDFGPAPFEHSASGPVAHSRPEPMHPAAAACPICTGLLAAASGVD